MSLPDAPAEREARYRIRHITRFVYGGPVRCTMSLCLRPIESPRQRLLDFRIETTPSTRLTTRTDDHLGNVRHLLTLHQDHQYLEVVSKSHVTVTAPPALPDRSDPGTWEMIRSVGADPRWWYFTGHGPLTRPTPSLNRLVAELELQPGPDPLDSLIHLSSAINDVFEYTPGATSVDSPIDDILTSRKGVCQDYTHVLVAIARSWGVPTRYVSGYYYAGDGNDGQALQVATHAWAESLLPGLGWIGIDPTNRALTDERYVRIAVGRDYRDASPTRGTLTGGKDSRMEVDVRMTRL